jgi:hypothetical protein
MFGILQLPSLRPDLDLALFGDDAQVVVDLVLLSRPSESYLDGKVVEPQALAKAKSSEDLDQIVPVNCSDEAHRNAQG